MERFICIICVYTNQLKKAGYLLSMAVLSRLKTENMLVRLKMFLKQLQPKIWPPTNEMALLATARNTYSKIALLGTFWTMAANTAPIKKAPRAVDRPRCTETQWQLWRALAEYPSLFWPTQAPPIVHPPREQPYFLQTQD